MEERRNEILRELDRKGKVKVTDLSREFGCSEVTIRNDIKAMDIEGLLKRTHGGAVKLETAETESGDPEPSGKKDFGCDQFPDHRQ